MASEMKTELSNNEIEFMKQMDELILPNRKNVDMTTLKNVGSLVGIMVNTTCRTCATKGGVDMLNLYGQLKSIWDEYNKTIYTKFEEIILDEVVVPKIPTKGPVKPKKI